MDYEITMKESEIGQEIYNETEEIRRLHFNNRELESKIDYLIRRIVNNSEIIAVATRKAVATMKESEIGQEIYNETEEIRRLHFNNRELDSKIDYLIKRLVDNSEIIEARLERISKLSRKLFITD